MKKVSVEFHDGSEWLEEAWGQTDELVIPAQQVKNLLQRVANNAYNYPDTYGKFKRQAKHSIVIDNMRFEVKFLERTD